MTLGRLDEAARECATALRLQPDDPSAHFNLGQVLERQHRLEEAAREYREALRGDAGFDPAREALARLGGR